MNLRLLATCLIAILPVTACTAAVRTEPAPYDQRAEVKAFVDDMAERHGFDRAELVRLLSGATQQVRVLELISTPAERKPWRDYRPIFVNDRRIGDGVKFWREQSDWLGQASDAFGVEPEYLVAIIGVETSYGRNQGRFPVFDTLVTLGFDYPPRADFFRSELGHFLLLAREEGLDIHTMQGSYAGAMGRGQFISSSYRNYAVDFDGDGRRDLVGNWADAIGSVANYFSRHGWQRGGQVTVPARVEGEAWRDLLGDYKPAHPLSALTAAGVRTDTALPPDSLYALLELEGTEGPEHWVLADNFYVITRYNRSPLYAMAVYQLAQAIREAMGKDS